jgi:hypothetical protein
MFEIVVHVGPVYVGYPWSPKLVTAFGDNDQNVPTSMVSLMPFQCIHVDVHMESVEVEGKKERFCHGNILSRHNIAMELVAIGGPLPLTI